MSKELEIKGTLFDWNMSVTGKMPAKFKIFKVDDIPILERFFFYIDTKYEHGDWFTAHGCLAYARDLVTERYQDVYGYVSCIERNNDGELVRIIIQPQRNDIYDLNMVPNQNSMYTMEISKSSFLKMEKWIKNFNTQPKENIKQ